MMHVVVSCSNPEWKNSGKSLKEAAESALLYLFTRLQAGDKSVFGGYFPEKAGGLIERFDTNLENLELEINLVDAGTMALLNDKYGKKEGTATVLSFGAGGEPLIHGKNSFFLGEIFLSPEVIDKKGGKMEFYLIHGLLHLFGFSHETQNDRMIMEKAERDVLKNS